MLLALLSALLLGAHSHSRAPFAPQPHSASASRGPELSPLSPTLLPFALGEARAPGRNVAEHSRISWLKSKLPAALVTDEALLLQDLPAARYAAAAPPRCLGLSPPDIVYPFHYFW
jgi:hypothetical protein